MSSNSEPGYDVFLSYQWDVKESVLSLYNQLTKTHGFKVWMDEFEMGSGELNESKNRRKTRNELGSSSFLNLS